MIGSPRVHWRVTDSTNERAKALALAGAPHGTLVTADEQSAGRGRQGRSWTAPPRSSVLMSVLLRGLDERHALLPIAAALAVCDTCEQEAGVTQGCQIKWPNDVWIDGRKVAGILIEGRPQDGWAVVGIGLNVDVAERQLPEELRSAATSLAIAGSAPPVEATTAALVGSLGERLVSAHEELLGDYRRRDALRGRPVRWHEGQGTAAGIDEGGGLLVETDAGTLTLEAGEVHLALGP